MVGVGRQGMSRLREFLRHADTRIAAISDVDRDHADRAVAEVEKVRGQKPKAFTDFRRVLEDREIDAVVVVTPDHWHAIPTVRAFETGKDVFVEKPLSYSVAEGRMMADASLKYKRVSQMGNHIHNDHANYRRVVELVQSGRLGRITRVHIWKTSPTQPEAVITEPPTVPPTLDYDFWLGPAPKRPYHPLRTHFTYRHFWDYSGGTFIDFWCHIVDVAVWALDLKAPRSVDAVGGRFFLTDETETPDTLEAVLEDPNLLMTFSYRPTPLTGFEHMGHIGCLFEGTEASLVTNYTTHEVWVKGKKAEDFPRPDPTIPDSPGHTARVSRRDQSPQSRDDVQRSLWPSGHESGAARQHRVPNRQANSLGRREGAHRRRSRREPLSAAQLQEGLQTLRMPELMHLAEFVRAARERGPS